MSLNKEKNIEVVQNECPRVPAEQDYDFAAIQPYLGDNKNTLFCGKDAVLFAYNYAAQLNTAVYEVTQPIVDDWNALCTSSIRMPRLSVCKETAGVLIGDVTEIAKYAADDTYILIAYTSKNTDNVDTRFLIPFIVCTHGAGLEHKVFGYAVHYMLRAYTTSTFVIKRMECNQLRRLVDGNILSTDIIYNCVECADYISLRFVLEGTAWLLQKSLTSGGLLISAILPNSKKYELYGISGYGDVDNFLRYFDSLTLASIRSFFERTVAANLKVSESAHLKLFMSRLTASKSALVGNKLVLMDYTVELTFDSERVPAFVVYCIATDTMYTLRFDLAEMLDIPDWKYSKLIQTLLDHYNEEYAKTLLPYYETTDWLDREHHYTHNTISQNSKGVTHEVLIPETATRLFNGRRICRLEMWKCADPRCWWCSITIEDYPDILGQILGLLFRNKIHDICLEYTES